MISVEEDRSSTFRKPTILLAKAAKDEIVWDFTMRIFLVCISPGSSSALLISIRESGA
jgi:hypothetical protein